MEWAGVLEGHHAVDAEPGVAHLADAAHVVGRAGEAVHHEHGQLSAMLAAVGGAYPEGLVEGLAAVDDDGKRASGGRLQMEREGLHLLAGVGRVPVKVDAGLPHRRHAGGVEHGEHGVGASAPIPVDLRGMEREGEAHPRGASAPQGKHRLDALLVDGREHHSLHAGRHSPGEGLHAPVELRHIDMCVGIGHFLRPTSFSARWRKASLASSESEVALTAAMACDE